jgi:hypothetical protein
VLYHELFTPHYLLWNRAQESLDSLLYLNPQGPWPELQGIEIDFLANRLLSYFSKRPGFESIEKFPVTEGDWDSDREEWTTLHDPQGSSAVLVFESQEYASPRSQIFEQGAGSTGSGDGRTRTPDVEEEPERERKDGGEEKEKEKEEKTTRDSSESVGRFIPSFFWFDPLEWETVFGTGHRFLVRPMFLVS